jgi:hypothetical protein
MLRILSATYRQPIQSSDEILGRLSEANQQAGSLH